MAGVEHGRIGEANRAPLIVGAAWLELAGHPNGEAAAPTRERVWTNPEPEVSRSKTVVWQVMSRGYGSAHSSTVKM